MKVIIPLGGLGTRMRPHTWSRPKPLVKVAGNTVVGHLLDKLAAVTTDEVIFIVGYKADQIEAWLRAHYGHLKMRFVIQDDPLGQAHAIWLCRDFLDDGETLIAFGDGVVQAAFDEIAARAGDETDAVFLVQEVDNPQSFGVVALDAEGYIETFIEKPDTDEHRLAIAGVYWFRSGRQLRDAVDAVIAGDHKTKGEYYLADAFQIMLQRGARLSTQPVHDWLDAGKPDNALFANQRLLATDYATADAIERSYGEDFTVLPPVYLHPTAVVEAAVIGPYVSVDAGATIRNAVVRNSIIDENAVVEHCVLDGALVGERAHITGRAKALFVGDDAAVDVG